MTQRKTIVAEVSLHAKHRVTAVYTMPFLSKHGHAAPQLLHRERLTVLLKNSTLLQRYLVKRVAKDLARR